MSDRTPMYGFDLLLLMMLNSASDLELAEVAIRSPEKFEGLHQSMDQAAEALPLLMRTVEDVRERLRKAQRAARLAAGEASEVPSGDRVH